MTIGFDALGFLKGQNFLETPILDSLARDGAHIKNAFVTTALCSPSRASILTGKYAHKHKIVDNNTPIPRGTTFFPQYLQQAGYSTGFFGKWHMGAESDDPATRLRPLGQFPRAGHLPAKPKRAQHRRQACPAKRIHHRRTHRLCARLAEPAR